MKNIATICLILAAAGCLTASGSQALSSYYVAGSGLTPAWDPAAAANQMTGGPTVYTLSTSTTNNGVTYCDFKVTDGDWNSDWPGSNARVKPDATGSNTFYFFPGATADGWTPVYNRVGFADPGGLAVDLAGDFNGWPNGPAGAGYQLNAVGNGVYSNNIVITTAGTYGFKFRLTGSWDISIGTDFGNSAPNASLTTTTSPQTLAVQLDLPNGRWIVGAPVWPVTNEVVFAVDMTSQVALGNFVPGVDSVFVSGYFNSWPGIGVGALALTNIPTYNGNTNIYYATNEFIGSPGSAGSDYKFTCNDSAFAANNYYEPITGNRTFNLLTTNGLLLLPVVSFGDVYTSDYLPVDVLVTFTINMTNAMTSTNSPSNLNFDPPDANTPHTFDPNADSVVINGNFLSGGWTGWNPIDLIGNIMDNNPLGSEIYQFTYLVPKGSPVEVHYKFGLLYAGNLSTNSIMDNEAAVYQDHVRYIRVTATGSYNMPMDTFGNQYVEPSFGELAVGPATGGTVGLQWLGRPGVHVQATANLAGGSWADHFETDGTNWTAGSSSPDGFLSATNWPNTGGNQFFRLIKP